MACYRCYHTSEHSVQDIILASLRSRSACSPHMRSLAIICTPAFSTCRTTVGTHPSGNAEQNGVLAA